MISCICLNRNFCIFPSELNRYFQIVLPQSALKIYVNNFRLAALRSKSERRFGEAASNSMMSLQLTTIHTQRQPSQIDYNPGISSADQDPLAHLPPSNIPHKGSIPPETYGNIESKPHRRFVHESERSSNNKHLLHRLRAIPAALDAVAVPCRCQQLSEARIGAGRSDANKPTTRGGRGAPVQRCMCTVSLIGEFFKVRLARVGPIL